MEIVIMMVMMVLTMMMLANVIRGLAECQHSYQCPYDRMNCFHEKGA